MPAASIFTPDKAQQLAQGKVGIIPTDTLYGLAASALRPAAVEKLYKLKDRSAHKPCIILIDTPKRAREFGVPEAELAIATRYWPGPLSVIFSSMDEKFAYLKRDLGWPPLRVPDNDSLREFLRQSGPLCAPSANHEGDPPAETIRQAVATFGNEVDLYIDGGSLSGEPSTVVRFGPDGSFEVVRQGRVKLG